MTARPISSLCTWDNMIEAVEEYGITSMFCPLTVWIGILRSEGFDPNRLGTVTKGLLRRVDHAGGDMNL